MTNALKAATLGALLALGLAATADAHAKLIKSDPPAGGVVKDRRTLKLTFNESLAAKLSGAEVKDSTGKTIAATTLIGQGNKGLAVLLKQPLKAGAYRVDWRVVTSDDGHRTTGSLPFKVN
jgi:methionine-rich copper-binding protein CopC